MRISDWSSDVCSSDLAGDPGPAAATRHGTGALNHGRKREGSGQDRRPHGEAKERIPRQRRDSALQGAQYHGGDVGEIGRASCRERVCQYGYMSVVAVYLKQKVNNKITINNEVQ